MYIQSIKVENSGPIDFLSHEFSFSQSQHPKPTILVGQNGSGKSIVLSNIVNSMLIAQATVYDDSDIEKHRVYKLRSSSYIKYGQHYSLSMLSFSGDFVQSEIQLNRPRDAFEDQLHFTPLYPAWNSIEKNKTSHIEHSFHKSTDNLKAELAKSCLLYFPPNRFEEPAWANTDNLINRAEYTDLNLTVNVSGRPVINYAPMRANQDWLLDILYDAMAVERRLHPVDHQGSPSSLFSLSSDGPATNIMRAIGEFLLVLFQKEGNLSWSVGSRGRRSIGVKCNQEVLTNNLFSLSTGQAVLLDVFLTIIRDADLSDASVQSLDQIEGLVVVDEVDLHLHVDFQCTVLPRIISLFPRVQFILSSHSPFFLMGLKNELGADNFDVVGLPEGTSIDVERFKEFEDAYKQFRASARFELDMSEQVGNSHKPVLFVEGSIDLVYLERASVLLGREQSLERYCALDANGFGGLDKVWRHFNSQLARAINQRVLLLYDCDVKRENAQTGAIIKRVIPMLDRRIRSGVENLFGDELMERAKQQHPEFIDVTKEGHKTVRGEPMIVPESWKVNEDEKKNLAQWICERGVPDDFLEFNSVFDILDAANE